MAQALRAYAAGLCSSSALSLQDLARELGVEVQGMQNGTGRAKRRALERAITKHLDSIPAGNATTQHSQQQTQPSNITDTAAAEGVQTVSVPGTWVCIGTYLVLGPGYMNQ
jgi:L-asparaginase II